MRGLTVFLITPLIGCATDESAPPIDNPDPVDNDLVATIDPIPGRGTASGSAEVSWTQGAAQFTASVAIANDIPTAARPWHVHFGTCATGGDIVGPSGSYPLLVVDATGSAQMTTVVAYELDRIAPYHINVHESQAALATIIACGNLMPVGTGGGGGGGGGGGSGY